MPYPSIDFFVRVPGAFGAELPDGPLGAVFEVEEFDEVFEGVAVGDLRVGGAGAGGGDDGVGDVAEVEAGFCCRQKGKRVSECLRQGTVLPNRAELVGPRLFGGGWRP